MKIDELARTLRVQPEVILNACENAAEANGASGGVEENSIRIDSRDIGVVTGTLGVWDVSGKTADGGSWEMIVKGIRLGKNPADPLWDATDASPSDPFHWRREIHAYASNPLEGDGVGGLRTPASYGTLASVQSLRERIGAIAIEKVDGKSGKDMTRDQIVEVSRAMGRMQGEIAGRNGGAGSWMKGWMAKGYFREYVRRVAENMPQTPSDAVQHPWLRSFRDAYQGNTNVFDSAMELWDQRESFLKITQDLPLRTLAHNDFWQGQFIRDPRGDVVIDLSSMGDAPLGADTAKLSIEIAARDALTMEEAQQFDKDMFEAYLEGLGQSGLDVENPVLRDVVQLGWSASIAAMESYRLGFDWVPMTQGDQRAEVNKRLWGDRLPEEVFDRYAERTVRLLDHAQLARDLHHQLAEQMRSPQAFREQLVGTTHSTGLELS